MLYLLARVARAPRAEQWRVVRILVALVTIEVLVRTVPLPRVARVLGIVFSRDREADGSQPPPSLKPSEIRMLRTLRRVVAHWPFAAGPCLREALVAGYILRRRRPSLRIGAAKRDGAVVAHAWLEIDGEVIGGNDGFVPLALETRRVQTGIAGPSRI